MELKKIRHLCDQCLFEVVQLRTNLLRIEALAEEENANLN